jgi:hypothetical protein
MSQLGGTNIWWQCWDQNKKLLRLRHNQLVAVVGAQQSGGRVG